MPMCERERMKKSWIEKRICFEAAGEIFSGLIQKLVRRQIERIASSSYKYVSLSVGRT